MRIPSLPRRLGELRDAVAPADTQLIAFRTVRDMLRAIRAGRDTPLRPLSATTLLPFNAKRMLKRVEVEVAERADAPEPVASERAIARSARWCFAGRRRSMP